MLNWRILRANGQNAANGSNGFHNPTTGTYAGAVDSVNGGLLPNMVGKHVALLDGGSAGNHFLQSTQSYAAPNTTYTLNVTLGVRDNPASFGTAQLEITANGVVVASGTFNKTALDTLKGSDAAGSLTLPPVVLTLSHVPDPAHDPPHYRPGMPLYMGDARQKPLERRVRVRANQRNMFGRQDAAPSQMLLRDREKTPHRESMSSAWSRGTDHRGID